jgi:hypothetical protein
MQDVLFLLLIVGFFGVAAALVAACERIVGPDPSPTAPVKATSAGMER